MPVRPAYLYVMKARVELMDIVTKMKYNHSLDSVLSGWTVAMAILHSGLLDERDRTT